MSQKAFLTLLRQYASLSQRFRRSYADVVNALVQLRVDAIIAEFPPGVLRDGMVYHVLDIAQREYGTIDRDFQLSVEQHVDKIPF